MSLSHSRLVRLRLEKIQRDFFQGGRSLERKCHLVSLGIVCTIKHRAGLGVTKLDILNVPCWVSGAGTLWKRRGSFDIG